MSRTLQNVPVLLPTVIEDLRSQHGLLTVGGRGSSDKIQSLSGYDLHLSLSTMTTVHVQTFVKHQHNNLATSLGAATDLHNCSCQQSTLFSALLPVRRCCFFRVGKEKGLHHSLVMPAVRKSIIPQHGKLGYLPPNPQLHVFPGVLTLSKPSPSTRCSLVHA